MSHLNYKIEKVNSCDDESDSVCGNDSKCIQTWGGDELCIDSEDKKACDDSGIEFFECSTGCHFCEELVCDFQTHYVECDVPQVKLSADDLATVFTYYTTTRHVKTQYLIPLRYINNNIISYIPFILI